MPPTSEGSTLMAARAMWKGVVVVGDLRVPVKLYSAVEDRRIHFRLLHEEDRVPLEQRMINPVTGRPVDLGETQRGLEVERELFVRLTNEELEALGPEASREIRISRFVPPEAIGHQWYDRPYYLGPDGKPEAYAALAQALYRRRREGVTHWVMRKKRYVGALREQDGRLALLTVRHAEEVIFASELDPPTGRALESREREMAEKFVLSLVDEFDPEEYRDEYRDRVRRLIEMKRRGETVEIPEYEEKPEPEDLAALLEASLAQIA